MTVPTSEKRLTRSQVRAGSATIAPSGSTTPSSAVKSVRGFSKAGRRVLGELACNDSPVVGLLPSGTPASCKEKFSDGSPFRSRRALLVSGPSHPASTTPLGESLLRMQVQLLLQKVESEVCTHLDKAPCPRTCIHPHAGSGIMASPTMLAAPTPLNTPVALAATTHALMLDSQCIVESSGENDLTFEDDFNFFKGAQNHQQILDVPPSQLIRSPCTANSSSVKKPQVQDALYSKQPDAQNISSITSLLTTEGSDVPSSTEIFLGKRTLHFDDDTPCKSPTAKPSETRVVTYSEHASSMRELDDDEVSEWSVHVNVGSPASKQNVGDLAVCTMTKCGDTVSASGVVASSSIHEHVKKTQQVPSHKVDLLWNIEGREGKATSYGRQDGPFEEDENAVEDQEDNDVADYSEDYYFGREDEEDDNGECDSLCDMFKEMKFVEGKGLPRGEGKHIRFLYEDGADEFSDAMVVHGEEEVVRGGVGMRLKGLPAPVGRHWRFAQGEDEDEEEHARH